MKKQAGSRESRMLLVGIGGCLLFIVGDFLYAAVGRDQSTETLGLMVKAAYLDMGVWRMTASILCGALGTVLYYLGFHQMDRLLQVHAAEPRQKKWVRIFRVGYMTGTIFWAFVHAMFMNVALIFKFVFDRYGDMQAAADIANRVFLCNAVPMAAAYVVGDGVLSVALTVMVWNGTIPLKNTAQRILATFCNPIVCAGVVGNLFTLLPWPLNQIDIGSESLGHLLALVLGLVLLREMARRGELKNC